MVPKLLVALALAAGQSEDGPVMMICQPESFEADDAGEHFTWTCPGQPATCGEFQIDLSLYERRGPEQVHAYSTTEDGVTLESSTRLLADGRYEEDVRWTTAGGDTQFRRVGRGRCRRQEEE